MTAVAQKLRDEVKEYYCEHSSVPSKHRIKSRDLTDWTKKKSIPTHMLFIRNLCQKDEESYTIPTQIKIKLKRLLISQDCRANLLLGISHFLIINGQFIMVS